MINWTFAKNDGGRDSGFHDAGVETFKGGGFDKYLARELGQNSLDARLDATKPVTLKFDIIELDRGIIPDIDALSATFSRCANFWDHDKKAKTFFQNAHKLARDEKISVLRIGDYNTTGVKGDDSDKRNGWYNLIRCAGSSPKNEGEGGSFGIGKNAPFAASQMRTVLYSTFTEGSKNSFVGVATLATHDLPRNGGKAQAIGFLGGAGGSTIHDKNLIPAEFARTEAGTNVFVLGFPNKEKWENDLIFSMLDNFWPSIHFGDLEVHVGSYVITKQNIHDYLLHFSAEEDFTAHLFYNALTNPTITLKKDLPRLGVVEAFLYAGDSKLPKRVLMVRKTGMVIFPKRFQSPIPYSGVFLCRNEKGNIALREMEPPKHDVWDPDHPEKNANKKIETEYVGFIREAIAQLVASDDEKEVQIYGMSKFLPDDDESPEEEFASGEDDPADKIGGESYRPNALPPKIEPTKMDVRKKTPQPLSKRSNLSDLQTDDGGEDEMSGGGPAGDIPNDEAGGKGDGTGAAAGQNTKNTGAKGSGELNQQIPIRFRSFASGGNVDEYTITIHPQIADPTEAKIALYTVGDDQKGDANIKRAIKNDGTIIEIKGGVIGPITLTPNTAAILKITLSQSMRVAMEVIAYEA